MQEKKIKNVKKIVDFDAINVKVFPHNKMSKNQINSEKRIMREMIPYLKSKNFDLKHAKGICANECPKKAIVMVLEGK